MTERLGDNDGLMFRTIDATRFPLIVLVVWTHVSPYLGNPAAEAIPLGRILDDTSLYLGARFAVAAFSFIAGFLFFRNFRGVRADYLCKLRTRVRTLLVPYLLWNLLFYLIFMAVYVFLPSLAPSADSLQPLPEQGVAGFLRSFWGLDRPSGVGPICFPLYFVRNLMVAVVAAPVVFYAVRLLRWLCLPLFFAAVCFLPADYTVFVYFFGGAWLALNGIDLTAVAYRWRWPAGVAFAVCIIVCNAFSWSFPGDYEISAFMLPVGIMGVVGWARAGVAAGRLPLWSALSGTAFFVFAAHSLLTTVLNRLWPRVVVEPQAWSVAAGYAAEVAVTLAVCVGACLLLRRFCPRLLALLCGGR